MSEDKKVLLKSEKFITPNFTDEEMDKVLEDSKTGNIPAKLYLILHNQAIINNKVEAALEALLVLMSEKK